jgi:hypothetical protein
MSVEFPENLDNLPHIPFSDYRNLPDIAAVYVVHDSTNVFYVGATKTLRIRFSAHVSRSRFVSCTGPLTITWIEVPFDPSLLRVLELQAIAKFSPSLKKRDVFYSFVRFGRTPTHEDTSYV